MAQKKTLFKNRKRKAIIRKANPTLAFGGNITQQKGELIALGIPNTSVDECMEDLIKRLFGLELSPSQEKLIPWHHFVGKMKAADEFYLQHHKNSFHLSPDKKREYIMHMRGDWDIPIEQPKQGDHPLDFTQRTLGKWLNADGSEPNINTDY